MTILNAQDIRDRLALFDEATEKHCIISWLDDCNHGQRIEDCEGGI